MPSATTGKSLPYPLGTDRVMDGDDAIRKLAQSVDNLIQIGRVTVPITAAATQAQVTWTFPVPYAANPTAVLLTLIGGALTAGATCSIQSLLPGSVVINGYRQTGTGNFDLFCLAIGPIVPVT